MKISSSRNYHHFFPKAYLEKQGVDYSKINEQETELKAREYFFNAERLNDGIINEDMTM